MGKKLSIVGGGKMGEALLAGLLSADWASSDDISVVEPDAVSYTHLTLPTIVDV